MEINVAVSCLPPVVSTGDKSVELVNVYTASPLQPGDASTMRKALAESGVTDVLKVNCIGTVSLPVDRLPLEGALLPQSAI